MNIRTKFLFKNPIAYELKFCIFQHIWQAVAEPLSIWQTFGLHHFLHAFLILVAAPPTRGGAGRLTKSSDCVLEYFFWDFIAFFLIHQCEKGKPPTGVNHQDFFWRTQLAGSKQQDLWFFDSIFCRVIFFQSTSSAREGVDGTRFDTPVWEGEASRWCMLQRFFCRTQQAENNNQDLWICDSIFAGWFFKKNFSAREGVDGTSFGTLVQGGEALPLVYATKILLRNPGDWKQTGRLKICEF